ncbi:MAG: pyridoxine 5'-phosphate synthase [Verrucomicrobiota bacterium]
MKLGVNIDHVATVREARGTTSPSSPEAAEAATRGGAHGITIHLREDRRHIQDHDLRTLREQVAVPLNLELANAPEIVAIALEAKPDEVCMVPERREELTTEGGLEVAGQKAELQPVIEELREAGILVSLFIDPDPEQVRASAELGAPCIELHTGTFCEADGAGAERELNRLIESAERAESLGLQVNAGHGINLDNIASILKIPHLDTLNIGHSIVARSIFVGLEEAVREMLNAMNGAS